MNIKIFKISVGFDYNFTKIKQFYKVTTIIINI